MKTRLAQTDGQGLAEYALILALIAIVVIAALSALGSSVGGVFSQIVEELEGLRPDEDEPEPGRDCYGSLLLVYLVGLTALATLVFRFIPDQSYSLATE